MNNTARTARTAENYTFRYEGGYTARAIETAPNVYAVTMTAPNGDESSAYPTVVDAEKWMLRHAHGQATGHHMLCGCISAN
jgi:hypothetical protein